MQVRVIHEKESKKKRGFFGSKDKDSDSKNKRKRDARESDSDTILTALKEKLKEEPNKSVCEDRTAKESEAATSDITQESNAQNQQDTATAKQKLSDYKSINRDDTAESEPKLESKVQRVTQTRDDVSDSTSNFKRKKVRKPAKDTVVVEAELVDEEDILQVQPSPAMFTVVFAVMVLLCGVSGFAVGGELLRLLGVLV